MLCLFKILFCTHILCHTGIPDEAKINYADILIEQESWAPSLPKGLAVSVAAAESKLDHLQISHAGAIGIFQIMPIAEKHINENTGLSFEAKKRLDNIRIGLLYLEELWGKYRDIPKTLAAYNFGPGNVDAGKPYPKETRDYIQRVGEYRQCFL